jgi:signal transduction histidine kinase/PAS domain-containing protein
MAEGDCNEAQADEGARLGRWLQLLIEGVPALLWATDCDLRITTTLGASPLRPRDGELVGKRLADLFHDDELARHRTMHRRALAGEAVSYGWQAGDRYFRCRLDAVRDGDGRIFGVVGIAVDETAHERERRRLVEAERRLRVAQAVAHVGSWERDLDRDHAAWSDETYRLYGVSSRDFDGSLAAQLARCHPDDAERLKQAYALVTSRPGPLELDFRIVRPDGAVRMLHTRMEMLGPGRRVVGASQDVTDERAGQARLTSALSLLEATLDSTADGVLVVDNVTRRIVRHNAKFASLWRIPGEILRACDDAIALAWVRDQVADPEAFAAKVDEMYQHPERESYDEILLKDGRILERYSQAQRVDGAAVGRVWCFRDVTDRRRADGARDRLLSAECAARRAAQEVAARASLLADASRILTSLDHESALRALAGRMVESFADCCAVDLLEPDGSARRVAAAPDAARAERLPCGAPEGATAVAEQDEHAVLGVPLAVTGRLLGAMRYARPRARGFGAADLALAEDVAGRAALAIEIARAYRRTAEALRARDEFLSVSSHELRAPLATLQATADVLLAGAHGEIAPTSALARPLRSLGRQVHRLSRLANQILDAIALTTQGIDLDVVPADLASIAGNVVARLAAESGPAARRVELSAPRPVPGSWDRPRLEQLVEELLSNALRFGRDGPVQVMVDRLGDTALLTVRDHGVGIAPDRLPTLFQRFDRGGRSASVGGLGLGLYVARAVVELHGGSIRVESRLGEGTTFIVELPASRPWEAT